MKSFQALSFFLKIEEGPYLDLPLQGLDVVDDLIQHYRLPGHLNQTKSIPSNTKTRHSYEIHISGTSCVCVCSGSFCQKAHFAATRNKVLQKLHPLADLLPSQLHKRRVRLTNPQINF